nr:hypothetical protein [Tanacetum cinerariifolium]
MRPFECHVTIINTIDHLGKFNGKIDEGFFVGYSLNSKAFRVFNSRTRIVEENLHIRFSENTPNVVGTKASDNTGQYRKETEPVNDYILLPLWNVDPPFSQDQEKEDNVNITNNVNTVSSTINAAGTNEDNELPFDPNMPALEDVSIFNFSSDHEDDDAMSDMKNLDTTIQIEEEVYVCQPLGFKDLDFPDRVYKVEKALYGLHQALRAWYETLLTYLLDNGFQRGKNDKTLFIKSHKGLQVKQKNDGISISQDKHVGENLKKFRSMIGSLMYLTSSRPDIMFIVCACAKYQVNPKVSHLYNVKKFLGLESIEEKLKFFKTNESVYLGDIKLLKVEIQMKDIAITKLRRKLDLAQKEKDNIQLNVEELENASNSLNKLIDYQIVNNCKKELGYESYNAVPPPYKGKFMPPKPNLSYIGLDEFTDKLVAENTKSSKEETKAVRKNSNALLVEEWVSDDEEEVTQPKIE